MLLRQNISIYSFQKLQARLYRL